MQQNRGRNLQSSARGNRGRGRGGGGGSGSGSGSGRGEPSRGTYHGTFDNPTGSRRGGPEGGVGGGARGRYDGRGNTGRGRGYHTGGYGGPGSGHNAFYNQHDTRFHYDHDPTRYGSVDTNGGAAYSAFFSHDNRHSVQFDTFVNNSGSLNIHIHNQLPGHTTFFSGTPPTFPPFDHAATAQDWMESRFEYLPPTSGRQSATSNQSHPQQSIAHPNRNHSLLSTSCHSADMVKSASVASVDDMDMWDQETDNCQQQYARPQSGSRPDQTSGARLRSQSMASSVSGGLQGRRARERSQSIGQHQRSTNTPQPQFLRYDSTVNAKDPQSSDPNYPQGNLNVQDFISLDWNSAPGPIIDIDRARSLRQRIPKVLTVNDPTAAEYSGSSCFKVMYGILDPALLTDAITEIATSNRISMNSPLVKRARRDIFSHLARQSDVVHLALQFLHKREYMIDDTSDLTTDSLNLFSGIWEMGVNGWTAGSNPAANVGYLELIVLSISNGQSCSFEIDDVDQSSKINVVLRETDILVFSANLRVKPVNMEGVHAVFLF